MSDVRLIDGNELLKKAFPVYGVYDDSCSFDAVAVGYIKGAPTIEPPVVQWTSVEDGLPEEMLRILLRFTGNHSRNGLPMDGTTCGFLMGGTFYTDSGPLIVTHWMPLPEPPRRTLMLKIVTLVDAPTTDAQGFKEAIAMDFEKYGGTVRVVSVEEIQPEQMRMGASG